MPKKNPVLSVVIFLVIVSAAVGVLFLVLKPSLDAGNSNKTSTVPTVNTAATVHPTMLLTTTVSVTTTTTVAPVSGATPPSGWDAIVNDKQGYTAYRPHSWWFRLFSPDKYILGIDTSAIPENSEYVGVISLMRLSASNNFDSYLADLNPGFTTTSRVIDGRTWTIVEGKTKDSLESTGKYVKWGKVTVGSKEFMARLESSSSDFGDKAAKFEIFITTIKFD